MANRPVFMVREARPHYSVWNCEFNFNPGFSPTQKKKNIDAIHRNFKEFHPGKRILEISSKSGDELGVALSAFNLKKYVPALGKSVPVECVYQAGKVFAGGINYPDLLEAAPKNAKRDGRLSTSGKITAFRFDGVDYPTKPKNAFYDFLYISASLKIKSCSMSFATTMPLPISSSIPKRASTARHVQQRYSSRFTEAASLTRRAISTPSLPSFRLVPRKPRRQEPRKTRRRKARPHLFSQRVRGYPTPSSVRARSSR